MQAAGAAQAGSDAQARHGVTVREAGASSLSQSSIDAVALPAANMLMSTQLPDGSFLDPWRGRVGGSGLTRMVWVLLRQASRLQGTQASERIRAAELSLSRGTELDQVLPKWVVALVFSHHLQTLLPEPASLEAEVANLGPLHASGIADVCFQRPGCFNNYVLAGKLLNLELASTGLHATVPGARLDDPRLVPETLRWMARQLPRTTSETATIALPRAERHTGAALSDPSTYPLAYQTLCTALLTRATYLAGTAAPAAMRRLEVDALWELLGMTAPNGEISWMGRGQDIVWTLAASFYAAMQGSVLVAHGQPDLAARLRRLAVIDLGALRARLAPPGLRARAVPGVIGAEGVDTYYGPVGVAALALVWLELAREVAPSVSGRQAPIPAEVNGAWTSDPHSTHLLTLRRGNVWLGVSTRRVGYDARTGWGLLRALRREPSGAWVALLPDRPIAPEYAPEPAGGPLLLTRTGVSEPHTEKSAVRPAGIVLSGRWSGTGRPVKARWAWSAYHGGVQLTSTCPRRRQLRFTEWLPSGTPVLSPHSLAADGFSVSFSQPISVGQMPGSYASAREPALTAYQVSVKCTGAALRVRWSGSEAAPA